MARRNGHSRQHVLEVTALMLGALLALGACAKDGEGSAQLETLNRSNGTATATTTTVLPTGAPAEMRANPADWVLPGHDYDNSRATFDSTITAANVGTDLQPAWTTEIAGGL